ALIGGLRADALHVFVKQVLKLGALALVAGGGHVGDVAGDDLDLQVHGCHAGCRGIERTHLMSPQLARFQALPDVGVCESWLSAFLRCSLCCCRTLAMSV